MPVTSATQRGLTQVLGAMFDDYLNQVPRRVHVLWARVLSVAGCLLTGFVFAYLLASLFGLVDQRANPGAIAVWGVLFSACTWVFAQAFFSTPRRPTQRAVKVFAVLNLIFSLAIGLGVLLGMMSRQVA